MARSTSDPNLRPPKGMHKVKVIRTTIKDSLGQYCVDGDFAILKKDEAQHYLDLNMVRVELPDLDDESDTDESADGADVSPEAAPDPKPRTRKRAARSTANSS
ncbi:MAG: hypothetical protein QNJ16_20665 [Rhodobacter sp.]|nr:hypothetical protein [Rhodobacter sp.]